MTRKRSKRRTLDERRGDLDDLYDYARPKPLRAGRRRKAEAKIVITDDWPDVVPITETELRVIEAHFGDELDKIFGPGL